MRIFKFIAAESIFWLLRLLGFLPYSFLYRLSQGIGFVIYHTYPKFRKRALSNLSLAKTLHLNEKELKKTALASFQNLALTFLEYGYIIRKRFQSLIYVTNPDLLPAIKKKYASIVFFSPHFANWEIPFLDLCTKTEAIAVGRPFKNEYLYARLTALRESTGGKMIEPKNAISIATKALKSGICVGMVADQGLQESSYKQPFLGRMATNTTAPALLAYKTNKPLIVGTSFRDHKQQPITYNEPILPDTKKPLKQEVFRMMHDALAIIETAVKKNPSQWLWVHNRWKMPTSIFVAKKYRYECFLIILPNDPVLAKKLSIFETIYPHHFITVMHPKNVTPTLKNALMIPYQSTQDLFKKDYSYKLVFDFTNSKPLRRFYKKLSVLTYVFGTKIQKNRSKEDFLNNFEPIFTHFVGHD